MKHRRCQILISVVTLLASGSLAWSLAPIPSRAQSLLRERDQLQQDLLRADQAASEAMLRGEDPVELYAEQTGLQEQIDIIQMRLESLAMRLEFDIPALPESIREFDPNQVLDESVGIGRRRAEAAMAHQCEVACGAIVSDMNFTSFLAF
ncbi:MAG: hypothetical protein MK089_03370 [Phycisphaerales bacterium]|nr:hypothetical protein [Phycisphaerales bacterium]